MRTRPTPDLELRDIQGLLLHGHAHLHGAEFLRMRLEDRKAGRDWLRNAVLPRVTTAEARKPDTAIHVAFTAPGLTALGLDPEVLGTFSKQFQEGMVGDHRSRALGDQARNSPLTPWDWGHDGILHPVHGLLLVYARDREAAHQLAGHFRQPGTGWTLEPLPQPVLLGDSPPFREHFGFADGIGDPVLDGSGRGRSGAHNIIAPGEFILGYLNQSGQFPDSPRVARGAGELINGDLGRNGSYLVVRQLEQHVIAFWRHLLDVSGDHDAAIHLAAKMVGRWRNGAPLAKWSAAEPEADPNKDDDFLYATDRAGNGCPLGAHIRRVNPRDGSPSLDPERSIEVSKRRRLLRRGRTYGAPARGWPEPGKILEHDQDDFGRGIHFLCFNANLETQFEFVQQSWIVSRKLGALGNDADPILSNPDYPPGSGPSDFTIQHDPVNRRLAGLPAFVTVRGGGYFFLPGCNALHYLTRVGE
jgi:Dyp-type peroxidase family